MKSKLFYLFFLLVFVEKHIELVENIQIEK